MGIAENKELVRRYVEDFVNQQDYDVGREIFAADFIYHGPSGVTMKGCDAYVATAKSVIDAFPDWVATVEDIVANNDMVWDRVKVVATHSVQSTGGAPTGETFSEGGVHIWHIANGKLAEAWLFVTPKFLQCMAYASALPGLAK